MPTSKDYKIKEYMDAFLPGDKIPQKTSLDLLQLGICICENCGSSCSIDYKFCKKCNEVVLIVTN